MRPRPFAEPRAAEGFTRIVQAAGVLTSHLSMVLALVHEGPWASDPDLRSRRLPLEQPVGDDLFTLRQAVGAAQLRLALAALLEGRLWGQRRDLDR